MNLHEAYDRLKFAAMITKSIDDWSMQFNDGNRRHLGASMIGSKCERYLWFSFRWMFIPTFIPRMLRLFQRGHREEAVLWEMLRADGWIIYDVDPATGEQWRVHAVEGHFAGSLDAIGYPPAKYGVFEWVLIECKTNKTGEKFSDLEKYKVELAKPLHYAQANTYGYLKGLRFCVYFNTNKDDDRIHIEVMALHSGVAQKQIQKAEFVILSHNPPPKLHQNSAHYECKICDAREVCHRNAAVPRSCRSCRYAVPAVARGWHCNAYNVALEDQLIRVGCTSWQELIH